MDGCKTKGVFTQKNLMIYIWSLLKSPLFFKFPNRIYYIYLRISLSSTAEERYLDFSKNHPNLFNRISNVQIVFYLGVTPEFLSTIRKRIKS